MKAATADLGWLQDLCELHTQRSKPVGEAVSHCNTVMCLQDKWCRAWFSPRNHPKRGTGWVEDTAQLDEVAQHSGSSTSNPWHFIKPGVETHLSFQPSGDRGKRVGNSRPSGANMNYT